MLKFFGFLVELLCLISFLSISIVLGAELIANSNFESGTQVSLTIKTIVRLQIDQVKSEGGFECPNME